MEERSALLNNVWLAGIAACAGVVLVALVRGALGLPTARGRLKLLGIVAGALVGAAIVCVFATFVVLLSLLGGDGMGP